MSGALPGMLSDSPIATCVCDRDTLAITACNDAALALLRLPRDLVRSLRAFFVDAAAAEAELAAASTERRLARWQLRPGDGDAFDVTAAITQHDRGWLIQLTSITPPASIAPAILDRLGALLEHGSEGIAITNAAGIVEYVSPAIERILGVRPDEIIGKRASLLSNTDDVARIQPTYQELVLDPGASRTMLSRSRSRTRGERWVEATVTNLLHEPSVRGVISYFRDVTERVAAHDALAEAEAALRRSEASFRALIDHAPLAILVHRDERIIYANLAMASLVGHELAGLIGRDVFDIVGPAFLDTARRRAHHLEASDISTRTALIEGEFVRADGSLVAVEVEGARLDFGGQPATVVIARDLTERRTMVAHLAASDRLASVGTLAAGVAHEINNPLAFVQNNLALLADELPAFVRGDARAQLRGADIERLLRDARDGAARIRGLVQDLRTLAHPDEDSVTLVDIREVLETCIRMAENEIRHRARLVTRLDAVPPVAGNPARASQVFLNLLVNAVQAIPEGRISDHEIRVSSFVAPGGMVVGEVADTGGGIPESILGRIFDPFFTTKPVGLGTGLGLSICHGIVQAMHGEITVDTAVGYGTTIRVHLPATTSVEIRPAPPAHVPVPGDRMRVLVVDDEPAIGRSLEMLLGSDHDAVAVTRAADALARIAAGEHYDAVLCDLMMPEMNGMAFHDALQSTDPELAARIVFLTGGAFTPWSKSFLARVPNLRIEKPFDIQTVLDALRAIGRRDRNRPSS